MLTRTPTSEWKGPFGVSRAPMATDHDASDTGKTFADSIDDSSLPSAVSTDADNEFDGGVSSANSEDMRVTNLGSPLFAETKTSSDDCAANTGETPSSVHGGRASVDGKYADSATGRSTPTRKQKHRAGEVPTYKIALASSLLERAMKSPRSPVVSGV